MTDRMSWSLQRDPVRTRLARAVRGRLRALLLTRLAWPRASDDPYADPDLARPYPFPDPPYPGADPATERENDSTRVGENPLDNPTEGRFGAVTGVVRRTGATRSLWVPSITAVLERPVDSQAYVDADQEPGL